MIDSIRIRNWSQGKTKAFWAHFVEGMPLSLSDLSSRSSRENVDYNTAFDLLSDCFHSPSRCILQTLLILV